MRQARWFPTLAGMLLCGTAPIQAAATEPASSTAVPAVCRFAASELQAGRRLRLEATSPERGLKHLRAKEADKLIARDVPDRLDDNDGGILDTSYVTLDGGKSRLLMVKAVGGSSSCETRMAYEAPNPGKPATRFLWIDADGACELSLGFFTYGKQTYAHESWRSIHSITVGGKEPLCSLHMSYNYAGAEVHRQNCTAAVCDDLTNRIAQGRAPHDLLDADRLPDSEPYWSVDVDNDGQAERVVFVSGPPGHGPEGGTQDTSPAFSHMVDGQWRQHNVPGFPDNDTNTTFIKSGGKVYTVRISDEGDIETKRAKLDLYLIEKGTHTSLGALLVKPHPVVTAHGATD